MTQTEVKQKLEDIYKLKKEEYIGQPEEMRYWLAFAYGVMASYLQNSISDLEIMKLMEIIQRY